MAEKKHKIVKHIGIISEKNSWTRELNIISWNGGKPKYDIRDWDADHEKMSKGITLTEEEARSLLKLLSEKKESIND